MAHHRREVYCHKHGALFIMYIYIYITYVCVCVCVCVCVVCVPFHRCTRDSCRALRSHACMAQSDLHRQGSIRLASFENISTDLLISEGCAVRGTPLPIPHTGRVRRLRHHLQALGLPRCATCPPLIEDSGCTQPWHGKSWSLSMKVHRRQALTDRHDPLPEGHNLVYCLAAAD